MCHACWVKAHSPAQPQNLVSKTPPKHTQLKRAVHCLWESRVWLHRTLKKATECPGHQLLLMMMSQASRGTAEPAVPGASQGAGCHRVGAPLSCSVLVGLLRPSTRAPQLPCWTWSHGLARAGKLSGPGSSPGSLIKQEEVGMPASVHCSPGAAGGDTGSPATPSGTLG